MERLRIELSRRKVACFRKAFRIGFFLDVKCANGCPFIYGCPIGNEFFVLRVIPQRRVRPEQAIDELAFLLLSVDAREDD